MLELIADLELIANLELKRIIKICFHAKNQPIAQSVIELEPFFIKLYKMVIWLVELLVGGSVHPLVHPFSPFVCNAFIKSEKYWGL